MQSLNKLLVYQDYDINKSVKIKNVFNLLFSVILFIGSLYALKMYILPYCTSELLIKFISIFDGKKLGDLENTLVPDIYRLTAFFPELDAELYVEWAARLLVISAISMPVVFIFNMFNSLFMLIRSKTKGRTHYNTNIIFTVTDISLCIVTYLSLLVIAVSVIHFTIMFILSVLNIGDSLFWYAILWGTGIIVFIIFVVIGIKHKVYRLIALHNGRENLLTYFLGILICLLPLVVITSTIVIIGIIVFILALRFLCAFAKGIS